MTPPDEMLREKLIRSGELISAEGDRGVLASPPIKSDGDISGQLQWQREDRF